MDNLPEARHSEVMPSILLVDDDRLILSTLSSSLKRAGYNVSTAESVDEAEQWLANQEWPDLVLLDMRMPGRDGLELAKRLGELNHIPFVLLTAYSEEEVIAEAGACGAMGYLVKPVDTTQLIPTIETAISRARELQNLRRSRQQLQTALDADRSISIAVGIVMQQYLLSHEDALEMLRNFARNQRVKLAQLAANVILAREALNLKSGNSPA